VNDFEQAEQDCWTLQRFPDVTPYEWTMTNVLLAIVESKTQLRVIYASQALRTFQVLKDKLDPAVVGKQIHGPESVAYAIIRDSQQVGTKAADKKSGVHVHVVEVSASEDDECDEIELEPGELRRSRRIAARKE
jgi:hypothetical protein